MDKDLKNAVRQLNGVLFAMNGSAAIVGDEDSPYNMSVADDGPKDYFDSLMEGMDILAEKLAEKFKTMPAKDIEETIELLMLSLLKEFYVPLWMAHEDRSVRELAKLLQQEIYNCEDELEGTEDLPN